MIPSPTSTTSVVRSTHLATARIRSIIASCETTSATSAYQPNETFPNLLVLGGGALELPGYREAALETAEQWSLPD